MNLFWEIMLNHLICEMKTETVCTIRLLQILDRGLVRVYSNTLLMRLELV